MREGLPSAVVLTEDPLDDRDTARGDQPADARERARPCLLELDVGRQVRQAFHGEEVLSV